MFNGFTVTVAAAAVGIDDDRIEPAGRDGVVRVAGLQDHVEPVVAASGDRLTGEAGAGVGLAVGALPPVVVPRSQPRSATVVPIEPVVRIPDAGARVVLLPLVGNRPRLDAVRRIAVERLRRRRGFLPDRGNSRRMSDGLS
jgi:hypothetical protein